MKRIAILTVAALAAAVARPDALDDLVPAPRQIVRGTNGVVAVEAPASSNGWYRLELRDGRPSCEAFDRDGRRCGRTAFSQLRFLAGRARIPDATIVDWPAYARRGLRVDGAAPGGDAKSMRLVIAESARKRLNTVVWRLEPGTNCVFAVCPDREFARLAYFAFKLGVDIVPALDVDSPLVRGREAEYARSVAALVPTNGMPFVDVGAKPPEAWAKALAGVGKRPLSAEPSRRIEPAPVPPEGGLFEIPADLARKLWRGDGE